ncbi:MAG: hypothetical protein ABL891_13215 [Burkholderiales bacterium]
MRALRNAAILFWLAGWLAGCEGVITGKEIVRVPLQTVEGGVAGVYTAVKISLSPEMNPVAVNFRADFTQNPAEYGKWNTYSAMLSKDGAVVAARSFSVNHPNASGPDSSPSPPAQAIRTLFYVDVQAAGEYELTITPVSPVTVTLKDAQVDARRNVKRPPQ